MRKHVLLGFLLAAFAVSLGRTDEGRTPIYRPTTITAPGHYVVTRDFSYPSGSGVLIQANNVTLDLDGHTITGPACGFGDTAIKIDTSAATQGIVIRNGRLLGGCLGIWSDITNRVRVKIQDVEVAGTASVAVFISATEVVEVVRCHIHDVTSGANGIGVYGNTGTYTGRVSENVVERISGHGILLSGMAAGEVRQNVVVDYGLGGGLRNGINLFAGSLTWGAGWNVVEGNTIRGEQGDTECDGIRLNDTSPFNTVIRNVVTGAGRIGINSSSQGTRIERNMVSMIGANGIESDGSGALIEENMANRNGAEGIRVTGNETRIERNVTINNGGHGIRVGSSSTATNDYVEENQTQANGTSGSGCGIFFFASTSGNVFRNNNVRANPTVPTSCNWTGNIDGGGNIQ